MSDFDKINDVNYVSNQYQNASNLNARISLHQKYSTNPYEWKLWLFDHIDLTAPCRVLELGCGTGVFWLANADRMSNGLDVTISDLSEGMLEQARQNLQDRLPDFQYKVIDIQEIPFEDASFDVIIASHMLYHVPDLPKALTEVRRVLKPEGRFYASAGGPKHLIELQTLLTKFDTQFSSWMKSSSDAFGMENGADKLGEYFGNVALFQYPDSMDIDQAKPLVDYVLSGRIQLSQDRIVELTKLIEKTIEENGGIFHITKEAGVFVAQGCLED